MTWGIVSATMEAEFYDFCWHQQRLHSAGHLDWLMGPGPALMNTTTFGLLPVFYCRRVWRWVSRAVTQPLQPHLLGRAAQGKRSCKVLPTASHEAANNVNEK